MKYIISFIVILSFGIFPFYGQSIDEARKLYQEGKYAEALPVFEKAVKSSPKNASYNQWYGTCLVETGKPEQARVFLKFAASKKITEAYNSLGHMHYVLYEFEESATAYKQYKDALIKEKKQPMAEEVTNFIQRAERAARMLSRCEDIQIIDSIIVDKKNFLNVYMLSHESGSIEMDGDQVMYQNPLRDKRYFSKKKKDNNFSLYSEIKLQDTWSDRKELILSDDSIVNNNYPFVLQDGLTIYYASTGNNSIGGYDLFITRYNINNDTYLSPSQMGMPFNSIANDYMMAIDEINNIGYFATDRFQAENKVVVYTFIPNEEIVSITTSNQKELINRAKITSVEDSWKSGTDYKDYLVQARKNIQNEQMKASRDFVFIINDNIIYYNLKDFHNDAAKEAFVKVMQMEESFEKEKKELDELRIKFSKSNKSKRESMNSSILKKENLLEKLDSQLSEAKMNARNLEIKYLRKQK